MQKASVLVYGMVNSMTNDNNDSNDSNDNAYSRLILICGLNDLIESLLPDM